LSGKNERRDKVPINNNREGGKGAVRSSPEGKEGSRPTKGKRKKHLLSLQNGIRRSLHFQNEKNRLNEGKE